MLGDKKENFKNIEIAVAKFFSKLSKNPNHFTFLSLFFIISSFYFLINFNLILASFLFLTAAFLDFIDGAVARFLKKVSKEGAYLDTICDRYIEGIILLGFLFLSVPSFLLPAYFWIFLSLFGSIMTTYAKSAAKEKEITVVKPKEGLAGRTERIIIIFFAIFLGSFNLSFTLYLIVILAVLSNITALQRIYFSLK